MAVRAEFVDHDDELSLPVFVPAGSGRGGLMEFGPTEEQQAVAEAAAGLLAGLVDPERVTTVESTEDRVDRDLWQALAGADLLGLAVPREHGGGGYGLIELCLLLEAQGNVVAPMPLWATLVLGALPIARFGSAAQRERWLPGVVAGEVLLTAALTGCAASPTSSPALSASTDGEGWCSTGRSRPCRRPTWRTRVVLPARTDGGAVVVVAGRPGGARRVAGADGDHEP